MAELLGDRYRLKGGLWQAVGRSSLTPFDPNAPVGPVTSRTNPTRGTYTPDNDLYAGILPGWTYDMYTPVMGSTDGLRAVYHNASGAVYENKIFWGSVRMQGLGVPTYINCIFAGQNPATRVSEGCVKNYGSGYHQATMIDCLVDPGMWKTAYAPGGAVDAATWQANETPAVGIHGGRVSMYRVQIRNCSDGMQTTMSTGGLGAPYSNYFIYAEDCWIHSGLYNKDTAAPYSSLPEGTHCDAVQFALGANYHFLGCYFGGHRDDDEYAAATIHGTTLSKDYWNSGHLVHQEGADNSWTNPGAGLGNMLTEYCFFEGGVASVNMFYDAAANPNPMPDWFYNNNYFVQRDDYNQLKTMGLPGKTSRQMYIIRSSQFTANFSNNKIITKNLDGSFNVLGDVPINLG